MPIYSIITVVPPKDQADPRKLKYTGRSLEVQREAPGFEWIVVGDADPQMTAQFAALNPVCVAAGDNAYNAGLTAATGDYVWFLPMGDCLSDAFVLRDVRRQIVASLRPDFFYGAARENGNLKSARGYGAFAQGMITHHAAMLYRRAVIKDVFDTSYRFESAYDFTVRFSGVVTKVGATDRLLVDVETVLPSDADEVAAQQERAAIRKKLLRQSDLRNGLNTKIEAASFYLRKKYPKVYWVLRGWFLPFVLDRKPSPVQSKLRWLRRR